MNFAKLIDDYLRGPETLGTAVAGMSAAQLDARPVPGRWSTRQVVCHITDGELVYADRMKRVIAEDHPVLMNLDPVVFSARLAYAEREVSEELQVIAAVRRHVGRILRTLEPACFQRLGNHSTDGSLTLEILLQRITGHIPHHVKFIEEKRAAMVSGDAVQEASEESFPGSDPPSWTGAGL